MDGEGDPTRNDDVERASGFIWRPNPPNFYAVVSLRARINIKELAPSFPPRHSPRPFVCRRRRDRKFRRRRAATGARRGLPCRTAPLARQNFSRARNAAQQRRPLIGRRDATRAEYLARSARSVASPPLLFRSVDANSRPRPRTASPPSRSRLNDRSVR